MKKIFTGILIGLFAVITMAATAVISYSGTGVDPKKAIPNDVRIVQLGTCNGGQYDTLATSGANVYGPIALASAGRPMSKGFRISANLAALDSGDSVQVAYQLLTGSNITDTIATWTVVDTLIAGKRLAYVDLSSLAGQSIVFRILNIDGTAALIQKPIRVVFKENSIVETVAR